MAYSSQNVALHITGAATAITDEACTEVSGTVFRITDAAKRILDPDTAIVVEDGGIPVIASAYTIDHYFGTITFGSDQSGSTITITAAYLPTYEIPAAFSGSMSINNGQIDVTQFGDSGRRRISTLDEVSFAIDTYQGGGEDFSDGDEAAVLNFFSSLEGDDRIVAEYRFSPTYAWRMTCRVSDLTLSATAGEALAKSANLVASQATPSIPVISFGAI